MTLRQLLDKYLAAAGSFGHSIPLSSLGLSPAEIASTFNPLDEDYHISRFLHLTNSSGPSFPINGFPQTHVSIDAEIQNLL